MLNRRLFYISRRFYHKNVIEHFENPKNVGTLDEIVRMLVLL